MAEEDTLPFPTFRPSKRRKLYRRPDSPPPPLQQTLDELIHSVSSQAPSVNPSVSVAELLRQRKTLQRKRAGIEFSASQKPNPTKSPSPDSSGDGQPSMQKDAVDLERINSRFAPQTGQVADVDEHMMAYIDAELARRSILSRSDPNDPAHPSSTPLYSAAAVQRSGHQDHSTYRQPAALGKLQEIDLGPDARVRNEAATAAARLGLGSGGGEDPTEGSDAQRGKRRWRNRRRRNSEDLRRDKMVEEVLRESRLDIYSPKTSPTRRNASEEGDDDVADDDRLAERFRADFLDAQQARRQPATNASRAAKAKAGVTDANKARGPKLGGSRSARAAMREKELAERKGGARAER